MGEIEKAAAYTLYPAKRFNIRVDMPQNYIAFVLGKTSMTIANSIRRICEGELLIKRLCIETIETNDAFMIHQYFKKMIGAIPINQKVSMDKTFILEKKINSAEDQNITTNDIRNNSGIIPLGHPIIRLSGTDKNRPILSKGNEEVFIRAKIKIVEEMGISDGRHCQCNAGSAVIQPIDEKPFAYGGEHSINSAPTKYYIKMVSRGGMTPAELLDDAMNSIKTRLKSVERNTDNIYVSKDYENLKLMFIPNETVTIGELLMAEVLELEPNCEWFTYNTVKEGILFRSYEPDMKNIVINAINSLVGKYDKLQKEFSNNKNIKNPKDIFGAKELSAELINEFGDLPYLNNGKKGYINL